ncbi:FG-GAP repeat protein [Salinigranum halophilum]|uniref:FG-GAP repeat protein n=1 Tax=Salinigranum halophilum TaxID=2565931 RepID=UPI0010A76EAB|nr:FG-GAP repeat protein [Salinigranum halophilum]
MTTRSRQATVLFVSALVVSAIVSVGVGAAVVDAGIVADGNLDRGNNDGQIGLCQWVAVEELVVPVDPAQNGFDVEFGRSVAVDGETGVVGTPGFAGVTDAVYVYDLSTSPTQLRTTLTPTDGAPNDGYGVSVAVSGDTVVVGASAHDAVGDDAGAVYVSDLTDPTTETKLTAFDGEAGDRFGAAVALDGDTLVVGAPGDDDGTGAVYRYDLTQSPPTAAKLTASDGEVGDRFGSSVAIAGQTVLVGAPSAGVSGAAYVADLTDPTAETTLVAADVVESGLVGAAVALSDGTALVGAPGDGSVHVFDLTAQPTAAVEVLADGTGFGGAVAGSGETVVVGSSGAVAIYDLGSAHPTVPVAEATGVNEPLFGTFGAAVAVDGETALVGTAGRTVSVYRCVD